MSVHVSALAIALAMVAAPLAPGELPTQVDLLVTGGRLVYGRKPVYPKLAQQMRISGIVKLGVLIGEDGSVERIRLLSGHPLLVPAAMDAVKHWRYEPVLRDGLPAVVPTIVEIGFRFGMSLHPPDQPGREQPVIRVAQPLEQPVG